MKTADTKVIYTDSSAHSCAGYIANLVGTKLVQSFSELAKLRSSTWRELKAVDNFLHVHKDLLKKQSSRTLTPFLNILQNRSTWLISTSSPDIITLIFGLAIKKIKMAWFSIGL